MGRCPTPPSPQFTFSHLLSLSLSLLCYALAPIGISLISLCAICDTERWKCLARYLFFLGSITFGMGQHRLKGFLEALLL
ncbi:hypothetical protein CIPAW_01G066300 [Carya illinoinensis]|uniref:Uncharacterized protein n=1 Tax=Carya illinoinensis TaxID=32201 RepID=A0A8T1RM84_CARIL|nr:hypothetical protein CIPAW_01G066300 [Carya illinoinensis]